MNMKKYFLLTILIAAAVSAFGREPEKGYRGFVDLDLLAGNAYHNDDTSGFDKRDGLTMFGISTTHGYQFNSHLFAGAGIMYAGGFGTNLLPVFADVRYDAKWNRFTPFGDLRIGYDITNESLYFSPNVGYRFNWGRKVNLNVGLGLTIKGYKRSDILIGGNRIAYDPMFNLRVGIDF